MRPGTTFVYAFENAGRKPYVDSTFDTTYPDVERAYVLQVERTSYADAKFSRNYPMWGEEYGIHHIGGRIGVNLPGLFQISPPPEQTAEGIVINYPESCGGSELFDLRETKEALRVPADPKPGGKFYWYECGSSVKASFEVAAVGQKTTVPAGTFETFVLERRNGSARGSRPASYYQREYWSEEIGLIKIEKYYGNGSLLGSYLLTFVNLGTGQSRE